MMEEPVTPEVARALPPLTLFFKYFLMSFIRILKVPLVPLTVTPINIDFLSTYTG